MTLVLSSKNQSVKKLNKPKVMPVTFSPYVLYMYHPTAILPTILYVGLIQSNKYFLSNFYLTDIIVYENETEKCEGICISSQSNFSKACTRTHVLDQAWRASRMPCWKNRLWNEMHLHSDFSST